MSEEITHTVVEGPSLKCLRCGSVKDMRDALPIKAEKLSRLVEAFTTVHESCPEPVNQTAQDLGIKTDTAF